MDDVGTLPVRHRVSAEGYYRMAETGILAREERVELIDGEIFDMAPIGQDHEGTVNGLTEALVMACVGRAIVSVQNSVRLDGWNVPQPDFAVFRRRADRYMTGSRPTPADVLLLVEVANSSLRFDRTVKRPLYARSGIAEFWLVDLKQKLVEVYTKPVGDAYTEMQIYRAGQIPLVLAPEIVVPLNLIFGLPIMP